MKTSKILEKALKYIRKGWTKEAFARNALGQSVFYKSDSACKWCVAGAILNAVDDDSKYIIVSKYLTKVIPHEDISLWNDLPSTAKEQVVDAFKNAIKLAKKDEAQNV